MERDVYRDDLVSNREPHMEEPRSTASYIREHSRPVGESPFLLAVAIAAAIAVVAVAFVSMQPDKIRKAPATTEQPLAPSTH
jgi:xanthine dehydrogenase molybdopterin-binding subunit B